MGTAGLVLAGAAGAQTPVLTPAGADGRPVSSLTVGETLYVGLSGLAPDHAYRVRLLDDRGVQVSYYQLTAGADGAVEPAALWYHSGVDGCARPGPRPGAPYSFQTFEQAEGALAGRTFSLAVEDETSRPLAARPLPLAAATAPRAYLSDATGCLMNAFEAGTADSRNDVYATVRHLDPARPHRVQLFLVPNRYAWDLGAPLADARGAAAGSTFTVPAGSTRFTAPVWSAGEARSGAYDLVVRLDGQLSDPVLRLGDLVSDGLDSGTVLRAPRTPLCPSAAEPDIAGRASRGSRFEPRDAFRTGEDLWGALDPQALPPVQAGGAYAALYVVRHGSEAAGLRDATERVEIVPVESGSSSFGPVRLWNRTGAMGAYDVVADLGADGSFDPGRDLAGRATSAGAWVLEDPALPGPWAVRSWSYAPSANPADPLWTDVSAYFDSPDSSVTIPMDHVPLHAEVRYPAGPAGAGPFPLVLVVHGNAYPWQPSEQGYGYLLDLLASHGMIAVSVDENFLNGWVWGEMDARAIVLLRHLQLWRRWNATPGHPFRGKVDLGSVGMLGHSRGGEAITVAWLFNRTLHNPADPAYDFNFHIKALYGLAPVDSQVEQDYAGMPVTLRNVDYFIMHGSHDGDVDNFQGQRTYDRADPVTAQTTGLKGLVYIYGANHNNWNTVWEAEPDPIVTPADQLIAPETQRQLAKTYADAFFRYSLQGETAYKALFTDDADLPSLPAGVTRVTQYQDPDRLFLDHYQEDADPATGSLPGVTNAASLLSPFQELDFAGGPDNPYWLWEETRGLVAGWHAPAARYALTFPAAAARLACLYPYLSLRVGQVYEPSPLLNSVGHDQDFGIRLRLGASATAALPASGFHRLPYPAVTSNESDAGDNSKTVLQTVRVPLARFLANGATFDPRDLGSLELLFNRTPSGLLAFDEIQLTR